MTREYESTLRTYLLDRIAATAGPIWRAELSDQKPAPAWLGATPPDYSGEAFPEEWSPWDKVLLIQIGRPGEAYRVVAREFDVATRRFGPSIVQTTRQASYLSHVAFDTLRKAFSPIARFRVNRDDDEQVYLSFKGQGIEAAADDFHLFTAGNVLAPIFRRNDRDGRPRPDGIQQVPWTYLVVEPNDGNDSPTARIFSGTRRPFGLRRRGRMEQFALTAWPTHDETTLQFISRIDPRQPMAGCLLYELDDEGNGTESKKNYTLVGVSDRTGRFAIRRTETPVRMLWIKSGKLLLAKLPVVPGLLTLMEVPLPDDEARLETEGELTAIRNDLIDLVARRSILMVRIHARLDAGDLMDARKLFERLDALPSHGKFNQRITQQEQLAKSNDLQTERRIKGMFRRTKAVLGSFLDPRVLIRLKDEINAASQKP